MRVIVHVGVWQAASTLTQGPRLLPSGNPSLPTPQNRLRYFQLVDGIRENVEYHPGISPGLGPGIRAHHSPYNPFTEEFSPTAGLPGGRLGWKQQSGCV